MDLIYAFSQLPVRKLSIESRIREINFQLIRDIFKELKYFEPMREFDIPLGQQSDKYE